MSEKTVTIESVLQEAKKVATKTASDKQGTEKTATDRLSAILENITEADTTKTASTETNLKEELVKQAEEVAQTNLHNTVKEAQFLGAAMADGFVSRMRSLDSASVNIKEASADDLEKLAEEVGELQKQAAVLGYQEAMNAIEKIAAEEYQEGQKAAEDFLSKVAEASYDIGHLQTLQILANSDV